MPWFTAPSFEKIIRMPRDPDTSTEPWINLSHIVENPKKNFVLIEKSLEANSQAQNLFRLD